MSILDSDILRRRLTRRISTHVNDAIVFVSDMRRSVSFYRDTIGLPLRFESPHW